MPCLIVSSRSVSLSSLYSLLKARLCPYFYLCSYQVAICGGHPNRHFHCRFNEHSGIALYFSSPGFFSPVSLQCCSGQQASGAPAASLPPFLPQPGVSERRWRPKVRSLLSFTVHQNDPQENQHAPLHLQPPFSLVIYLFT